MQTFFKTTEVCADVISPDKKSKSIPPMLPLLGIILLLFAALTWERVTRKKANGKWTLTEEFTETVLKELDKTEDCETYMLTARVSGWYLCKHCARGTYYLNANEVYKYGMSCSTTDRYQSNWLAQMRLNYTVLVRGDMKTARKAEITLLGKYPLLPENLARPVNNRLIMPAGNNALLKGYT